MFYICSMGKIQDAQAQVTILGDKESSRELRPFHYVLIGVGIGLLIGYGLSYLIN